MAYINKDDERILEYISSWSKQDNITDLLLTDSDPRPLEAFAELDRILIDLRRKRKADNQKTWDTIKGKRKSDPHYGRKQYTKKNGETSYK